MKATRFWIDEPLIVKGRRRKMKIKLKEKYMPRSKAIQMILRRKGWNIIPCGEEGEYILIDADQEDQENFIRWFCGETTWSPAGGILSNPMVPNVKYFESQFSA